MKGDVWYVSTFLFLVSLFFVTMIMLFSMSIARLIVGNLIDYTVHVTFLDFSLNTENALVSAAEIKSDPADPQLKRILSNAAFQWDGDPGWDKNVYVDGKLKNVGQTSKDIFDLIPSLIQRNRIGVEILLNKRRRIVPLVNSRHPHPPVECRARVSGGSGPEIGQRFFLLKNNGARMIPRSSAPT